MVNNDMKTGEKSGRQSYSAILRLAFPIVIQNLFNAAISSADVIMLNSVGQSSIAAVSLAVQYSNILSMVYFGIGTGATILCAQYWGKKNLDAIQKVEGIALRFSLGISLMFAIPAFAIPGWMMKIFTEDEELISIGAGYLRIVSIGYLCMSFSEVFLAILRSIERVRISTVLNVGTLLFNIFLNAVFVYGLFGAPALGARGVAIATAVSRVLQIVACFIVSALSRDVRLLPWEMFKKSGVLLRDFIHISLPALLNDLSWSIAFSTYSVIMGHLSADVVAANSIVTVVRNFGTAFCFGIASAAGIYVGKEIGANHLDAAAKDAGRSMRLTVISGIFGGLIVAASIPFVLCFVSLSETAMRYLRIMLLINVYYITGMAVNSTLISGLFRAGGDTRFGMICDTVAMWCFAVPLGFLSAFVLKLPPMWVYFLLCTDEFIKWPVVLHHYRSKKWIKNITRESI